MFLLLILFLAMLLFGVEFYSKVRYQLFMTEEDLIKNIYVDYCGGTENDHYIVRNGHT